MKRLILLFIIIWSIGISLSLYAQGPAGMAPFGTPTGEQEIGGVAVSPPEAEQAEAQKLSWFEKQLKIMGIAEKKSIFHEKSVAQIYKRLKDQEEWNKNYTLQRFLEVAKKVEEIGYNVAASGEHLILQEDGSYIRYYDGKPTDIFNLEEKDNYGNKRIVNIMNIAYLDTDDLGIDFPAGALTTHVMEYIKLTYDSIGAINYLNFDDAVYESNIGDRPSAYTTVEGAVEETDAWALYDPDDLDEAKALYDKIVGEVIPAIEAALIYTVTTALSNISYYTLGQDTATSDTPGGVYGEKASYDFTATSADAPDAPETGTVSDIQYYLLTKPFIEPLDELWWHAQDATLVNLHHDEDVREESSRTEITKLGITKTIDFYDATYDTTDNHNVLSSYRETHKINNTEVGRYYYHDIGRDSYGRQTGYTVDADVYGMPYTRVYSSISYEGDVLSRIKSYSMDETISGITTSYHYWDIIYDNGNANGLWQQTSYHYSINGVEHYRSAIAYNSYGLVESYMETYVEDGISIAKYRYNTYNANGLLSEYTEKILRQRDAGDGLAAIHEFWYVYVGNITYNNIYAIISYDQITIKDTNATEMTDYADKIPALIAGLTFNGVAPPTTSGIWGDWGFNNTTTVYIEKWRSLDYYSVGSYAGGDYYDLTLDPFRGRLNSYSKAKRTVNNSSDSLEQTNL